MNEYTKPMILANEDLAEGVFTASGTPATPAAASGAMWAKKKEEFWNNSDNGQITFHVVPTAHVGEHVTMTITYAQAVDNAWGGNYKFTNSGTTSTVDAWGLLAEFDLTIQVSNGPANDITSITIQSA